MYKYNLVSAQGLPALLEKNAPIVGLEIGVSEGETSEYLLMLCPTLTLHGVDPYINYYDWNPEWGILDQESMYPHVVARFAPYNKRMNLHKLKSDEAAPLFTDNMFDFIFIDGLHEYDQVLKDCQNYYSKVKEGGIFSGHDFNAIPGVQKAVKEFADSVNKEIFFIEKDVWYFYK